MITSLSDQRSFDRLRQHGCRVRVLGMSANWAPPLTADAPTRLAFAIPRTVGSAVVRNRTRRRVRDRVRTLHEAGAWPPGDVVLRIDRSLAETSSRDLDELIARIPELVREKCGTPPPVSSRT